MDTQPQRHNTDDCDHDQAVSTWLASEAFTDFTALTFGAAVKQAVDEQVAKGVTRPQ